MRQTIGIAVVTVVAVAGLWAWTITHSGANARVPAASHVISTADLTMKASAMPTQHFDAF
jgi:hypothetical protein